MTHLSAGKFRAVALQHLTSIMAVRVCMCVCLCGGNTNNNAGNECYNVLVMRRTSQMNMAGNV